MVRRPLRKREPGPGDPGRKLELVRLHRELPVGEPQRPRAVEPERLHRLPGCPSFVGRQVRTSEDEPNAGMARAVVAEANSMTRNRAWLAALPVLTAALAVPGVAVTADPPRGRLTVRWEKNFLRVRGDAVPGREIEIHYLEAYCRNGSTDRDWRETVIGHETEKVSAREDGSVIRLKDRLRDGVVVEHTITAGADEVDVRLTAHKPTQTESQAHWA